MLNTRTNRSKREWVYEGDGGRDRPNLRSRPLFRFDFSEKERCIHLFEISGKNGGKRPISGLGLKRQSLAAAKFDAES